MNVTLKSKAGKINEGVGWKSPGHRERRSSVGQMDGPEWVDGWRDGGVITSDWAASLCLPVHQEMAVHTQSVLC